MTTIIETKNISKRYSHRVAALTDVSINVSIGEFLTVMGASGSGKSTLLHILGGLTTPTSGSVLFSGTDIVTMPDSARTKFRLRHIGIVFQQFNLIPTLTAEENIVLPLLIAGQPVDKNILETLLETLEIKDRRKHRPDALSGGEQQRVAVGRALLFNPDVILADEPTGNLDSVNSGNLCQLLRKLSSEHKRTIIVVTHDKNVAGFGDRMISLKDGRVQQ